MFGQQVHRYIFIFGVCALAFGMMVGTVPTSVPQFILFGNWILELDFKRKWQQLRHNKIFWSLAALFLAHVFGLLYTHNLHDGWNDVRTKIPLMFLPLVFFSTPALGRKEVRAALYFFIVGCVANTLWCVVYSYIIHPHEQVRDASRFMSHIRLGLYLNVAIACCIYFINESTSKKVRMLFPGLVIYFVVILCVLGLASGLVNFILLLLIALCIIIFRQKGTLKYLSLVALLAVLLVVANYISEVRTQQVTLNQGPQNRLHTWSSSHRGYIHFDTLGQKENGNFVLINVQPEELQKAWKHEFPEDSFRYSPPHNLQRFEILVRYMASKGLLKDSAGYSKLSAADKDNIRHNVSNYQFNGWSYLRKRTYELINEYEEFVNGRNVNGHSLTMRLYFWKAAAHVIKANPLTGVGTGDVQDELNKAYIATDTPLEREWYKRPHNQFLTIIVALGIAGLLVFLWSLLYPVVLLRRKLHILYWPFFFLAVVSFLLEDTLETQAGLTFYAFFNTFFIANAYHRREQATP
jgi:O-antigen ligase